MNKFERKFGKYAIKNISLVLILCYAAGFVIDMINSSFLNYLSLDPYAILHGQVWRLVTWIIIPPSLNMNPFFILIMLYFYFSIGTSLEHTWGTYRYNIYLFSGMIFTIFGSFLLMGYIYLSMPALLMEPDTAAMLFAGIATLFSTYYVNMSIFLAYAATFSEARVLLFFIIPIKVKVLGIIYAIMLGAQLLTGSVQPYPLIPFPFPYNRALQFAIGASLLNFVIFFFRSKGRIRMSPRQVKKRYEFKQEVRKTTRIARHQCAICGITEEQDPAMEFRFCSKCEGNYEYCSRHLYTHTHIKQADKDSFERNETVPYDSDES